MFIQVKLGLINKKTRVAAEQQNNFRQGDAEMIGRAYNIWH